jgi:hypothetical protein
MLAPTAERERLAFASFLNGQKEVHQPCASSSFPWERRQGATVDRRDD